MYIPARTPAPRPRSVSAFQARFALRRALARPLLTLPNVGEAVPKESTAVLLALLSTALAAPEMIPADVWARLQSAAPEAADFEILLRDGGTFRMADHRGKKVVLSFWASWCAPCRRELPALSRWAKEHPDIVILAVNVDRSAKDAEKFIASVDFDVPVAFDPDARHLGKYGVTSMPTMFLFDSEGQLTFRKSGYSEEKGFAELEAALGGAK